MPRRYATSLSTSLGFTTTNGCTRNWDICHRPFTNGRRRQNHLSRCPELVDHYIPVWSHAGIICTGETYKQVVKLTFAKGASLEDPSGLFNASLEGNTRRAIDLHEGDKLDESALKALILAAVALNASARAAARTKPPAKS
ncbi:hypothetical protein FQ187_28960 [Pseudomonas sp. ANT_J28]|nr:hypothetical protein FQ187_28960 [Pseudomonas sp. ANT_J28]